MPHDFCATAAQIAHEIAHGGAAGGEVAFALSYNRDASPYRARGLPLYEVAVEFSWIGGTVALIGMDGKVPLYTYPDACTLVGGLLWGGAPVQASIVIAEAQHIPPHVTPARVAALEARLEAAQAQITHDAAQALREPWAGRPDSARRASYLARADAIDQAVMFDQIRGA